MINSERGLKMKKESKRLSRKMRRSFTIQTDIDELGKVLAELLRTLDIDKLHILTYKDRIDIFATKDMELLYVELIEKYFSLTEEDVDRIEEYEKRINSYIDEEQ